MNIYTYKSQYGDYTFSDRQIEDNTYLTSRQKEILHGFALGQSLAKNHNIPSRNYNTEYIYDIETKNDRHTLHKSPRQFEMDVDYSQKRWYESEYEFLQRMAKKELKRKTKEYKEVKRENYKIERSTYSDGTEITNWDKETRLFY